MMKELKNYYRRVSAWLPCRGPQKKRIMDHITDTVESYLAEHPETDFVALQAHFGTPEQIASAFVDEMGTDELLNALKVRRNLVKIAFICAFVLVAIWALAVASLWIVGLSEVTAQTVIYPPIVYD